MGNQHPRRRAPIVSTNPATGEVMQDFEPHSEREIERRLQLASQTFREFKSFSPERRGRLLGRVAEVLERKKAHFARTMTLEMGKPFQASVQEVEKCALACRYYDKNGARFLADEPAGVRNAKAFVRCQPLGAVLAVMPWNFPFWQVFRFAAPALMAGNVGLLKHASNVPQCALAIEEAFRLAGFPEGAFQVLLVTSDRMTPIIADPRVTAVTLTGSVGAGKSVAAAAGNQIKKTVLELGGSDPFIVMPSANLKEAVTTAVRARTINNGQSCIAAKRFIVHRRVADEFEERFVEQMASLKVGDPLLEDTDVGPLATREVLTQLEEQVNQTVQMGGRVLLGGKRLDRPGFFFAPTVLTRVPVDSPAYRDELFGPVASLFCAKDIEETLRLANDTPFGLGASAWTNNRSEREKFIDGLEAGMVFINKMVASDPVVPFGGIKQSGYGRELSHYGIREFVNIKTVVVSSARAPTGRTE